MLRPSIRLLAAALAGLWLAMPAVAAVHGAVDAHEYCAEHQAFEHRAADAGASASDDAVASLDGGGAQDQHDDCTFDDALVRDGLRGALPAVADATTRLAIEPARPCADAARPLAVLATAPKTSPPAA